MSRRIRRARRAYRRTRIWEGVVDELGHDSFGARLVPVDHDGPELAAEFDLDKLPYARPGVLFTLYTHRRGRRFRHVIRGRRFRLTAEQIAAAREEGARLAAELGWLYENQEVISMPDRR